ncbi:putative Molybdenum cofactor carrier [Desulfovibrio sp. X2]|uniref:putative molybdenum carrier protein n=1 Tax=Desulfovibrio sp. X2 TaxID=941449 RepID=UPI000358C34E|nr:putative molybdenum carrier protein [Desulfovibrio sp. X2]EPR39831.1 putative Molybdenum cofactor carrier [Desulfovibrio sp. X2]
MSASSPVPPQKAPRAPSPDRPAVPPPEGARLRIVSGGQTGVDRAALDAARALGLPHGGWCPRGRRAEDGAVPEAYGLRETASAGYRERTKRNVVEADATLILCLDGLTPGSELTRRVARAADKPCLVVDLRRPPLDEAVAHWLAERRVAALNVAGSSESKRPGIHALALAFLLRLLAPCACARPPGHGE